MAATPSPPEDGSAQGEIGRFFRHSAIYAVGNALNRAGAFLLLPVYTNFLTVADYGALELFYSVASIVGGILSMGLAHATLRFYFEFAEERDRRSVVSTNLVAALVIGIAGAALFSRVEGPLMARLFPGADYPYGLWLILITLVLELSFQVCLAYLRALERSAFFVVVTTSRLVIQLAANTILLVVYDAGVQGVLLGNLLAVAVGWLLAAGFTIRGCGLRFEVDKLVPVLKYSFPFLLATLVAIVSQNIDRFYISGLLSLEALGLYSLAMKFSRLTSDMIGEPFGRAYGAFRFTIMERKDAPEIQARIFRYLAAFLAVAGLGIVYFTREVLVLMADPKFWPAASLLPPLALAGVVQVLTYPLQTGFLYSKATRHIAQIGAVQAVLATGGSFILIKAFGLRGACVAPLLVALVAMVMTHRMSERYFQVRYEYSRLGWLAGLTAVFFVAGLPLGLLPVVGAIVAKTALLGLFGVVLVRSPVFEPDEIAETWALLRERWVALRARRAP